MKNLLILVLLVMAIMLSVQAAPPREKGGRPDHQTSHESNANHDQSQPRDQARPSGPQQSHGQPPPSHGPNTYSRPSPPDFPTL